MTKNFETLKTKVLELSKEITFEKAILEWNHKEIYRKAGSTCLCGHKPITNVCVLEHEDSGEKIEVGNECVHHFDMDFTGAFEQLKTDEKRDKNAEKHKETIDELTKIAEGSEEWEAQFLKSIIDCYKNGWKLSFKQHEILSKIKNNFYGVYSREVIHQLSVFDKCTDLSEWESKFLESIKQQIKLGREISQKQDVYIIRILKKNSLNKGDLRLPKEGVIKYTSEDFKSFKPREWQVEAYNKWVLMDSKATIEAGTGIGKTKFALMALEKNPKMTFLIVVPTEYLQIQWEKEIRSLFGDKFEIGKVGGGFSDDTKQITIAIINSIRHKDFSRDVGIFDEFHRYASDENISFMFYSSYRKVIGLSATIERPDDGHLKILKDYPICYTITQKEGIDAGYLCPYKIVNVPVKLTSNEQADYDKAQNTITELFPLFKYDYKHMQQLMMSGHSEAKDLNRAFNTRKKILNNAQNKIPKVLELINKHKTEEYPKTILFSELKGTADKIYTLLKKEDIPTGIYHSGLKTKERLEMMVKYSQDEYRVMVSVKALEEGIDVPNISMGIIVAGNSQDRALIQRTGRILRNEKGKTAILYQIYIPGTQDEKWARKRLEGIEKGIPITWGEQDYINYTGIFNAFKYMQGACKK